MTAPDSRVAPGPFLTQEGEPRAFVIVASARSGTNLLVSYLRQVAEAACFGEIFRGEFPDKPGWDRLASRLDLPATARSLHRHDLTAWWELVLEHGLRRRRWLGAKAFYYHREADLVWDRFAAADHRVMHLVRDATFEQYVSRLLAVESGEWKAGDRTAGGGTAGGGTVEPRVRFEREEYLRYREGIRAGVERTRARYGSSAGYVELEYQQLSDHEFVEGLLEQLFGVRVEVEESRQRQRGRPKVEYLIDPSAAEPFVGDSLSGGFAPA